MDVTAITSVIVLKQSVGNVTAITLAGAGAGDFIVMRESSCSNANTELIDGASALGKTQLSRELRIETSVVMVARSSLKVQCDLGVPSFLSFLSYYLHPHLFYTSYSLFFIFHHTIFLI